MYKQTNDKLSDSFVDLPEEMKQSVRADSSYRKKASLLWILLHQPKRFFMTKPIKDARNGYTKKLRYRLGAIGIALALLINLIPVNIGFLQDSTVHAAGTSSVTSDYSWLLGSAGTSGDPYQIDSPQALAALSDLVRLIPDAASQTEVTIEGTKYIVSGGAVAAALSDGFSATTPGAVQYSVTPASVNVSLNSGMTDTVPVTTPSAVQNELPSTFSSNLISITPGFAGSYFILTQDISLIDYSGESIGGAGDVSYWTPIGLMTSFLDGTPFLGTFDGNGKAITDFTYPKNPDPAPASTAGFGLFGYLGTGSQVHDLTVQLTGTAWPDIASLGGSNFAVGVIAAGSKGSIDNCAVEDAVITYTTVSSGTASTSVGGIVGLLQGSVSNSIFIGSIKSTAAGNSYQSVGGIAGTVSGSKPSITNCGAGIDFEFNNGQKTGLSAGVGGLVGVITVGTTISGSFTTGLIRANSNAGGLIGTVKGKLALSDSYSTASIGISVESATTQLDGREALGGLIGSAESASTLTNVYYAGGLLDPQIGAIAGYNSQLKTASFTNVAVDAAQAPHAPYKYSTVNDDYTPAKTLGGITGEAWSTSTGANPSLKWADESSNVSVSGLSAAASKKWVTLDSANSYTGTEGDATIYRLKEGISSLGDLQRTTDYSGFSMALAGGLFTGSAEVAGFSIPVVRKGLYASNQTEGKANLLDSTDVFLRFLDIVNLGGGGYIGGIYTLPGNTVGGASDLITIPKYTNGKLFCGVLQGEGTASVLNNISFPTEGSWGFFSNAFGAELKDFTIDTVRLGKADGSVSMAKSFGLFGLRGVGVTAQNIILNNVSYTYIQSSGSYTNISSNENFGFFFGILKDISTSFSGCSLNGIDVDFSTPTGSNFQINVGGFAGSADGGKGIIHSFTNCSVDASIVFRYGDTNKESYSGRATTIGGIIGSNNADCEMRVSNSEVKGDFKGGNVGGFFGRTKTFSISNSRFIGTIATAENTSNSVTTTANSGGFIGYAEHESGIGSINNSAVLGTISAIHFAGGLVGWGGNKITIQNSYASGTVTATGAGSAAGGITGWVSKNANAFTYTNCYFTGQVSGASVGGIAGSVTDISSVPAVRYNTCRYDTQLMKKGIRTVGNLTTDAEDIFQCGVKGEADAQNDPWVSLASDSSVWSYTAGNPNHYPQLTVFEGTDFSELSTVKLFRITDETLYNIFSESILQTVLPQSITSDFQLGNTSPFQVEGTPSTAGGYTTTSYKAVAAQGTDLINFRYSGLGVSGGELLIPYTVVIQMFDYGTGTAQDPYIIPDLRTLEIFRTFTNLGLSTSTTYFLVGSSEKDADGNHAPVTIDLASVLDWTPISGIFSGNLDGNNSTITNLKTTGATNQDNIWSAGLFTDITYQAVISDLSLTNAVITTPDGLSTSAQHAVGVLSARATGGNITGITVTGSIDTNSRVNAGGVIGYLSADVAASASLYQKVVSDVAITGSTLSVSTLNNGGGGIFGTVAGNNLSKNTVGLTLKECASYGTVSGMPASGGLIGSVTDNTKLDVTITDCFSLATLQESDTSSKLRQMVSGGLIGDVKNNFSGKLTINRSYYAGDNRFNYTDTEVEVSNNNRNYRLVGGFVGRVISQNSAGGEDFSNFSAVDSYYNFNQNAVTPWIKGVYSGTYWEFTPIYTNCNATSEKYSWSNTFSMSQPQGGAYNDMASWDGGVWRFADGLYPEFVWQDAADADVTLRHIAVHYTRALGNQGIYANLYVRYDGAELTDVDEPLFRKTYNGKMLVSTGNGEQVSEAVLQWNSKSRKLLIQPGVDATGKSDTSIFYINPDGMWAADNQWTVYTADALAGLGVAVNRNGRDANGIPEVSPSSHILGSKADVISLGRNISLSAYSDWAPIGRRDQTGLTGRGFRAVFDGNGYAISGLTIRDSMNQYEDLKIIDAGLFGVIDGGTVRNLAITPGLKTETLEFSSGIYLNETLSSAGTVAGILQNGGQIQNCMASLPIYGISAPALAAGGLVGRIEGDARCTIQNSAFTGYVYLSGKDTALPGTAGGLAGRVDKAEFIACYSAGFVEGASYGSMAGQVTGDLYLEGSVFDRNAVGENVGAVGIGNSASIPGTVPSNMGDGWITASGTNELYPVQSAFSSNLDALTAVRARMSISSHARSATAGSLELAGGTLLETTPQPSLGISEAGSVKISGASFQKQTDGVVELTINSNGDSRKLLLDLRCWYDDYKISGGKRCYTISTPSELAELAEIANGTINTASSQVGHQHVPLNSNLAYDDFTDSIVTLAGDLDLSVLTDEAGNAVGWSPIGTSEHPFNGTFEGAGHAVLQMNVSGDVAGLFGAVSGTVKNLLVSSATLSTSGLGGFLTASLTATGLLQNCGSSGASSEASTGIIGGLAGRNQGTITDCFSTAELRQDNGTLGGLVGDNNGGTVKYSYFSGYCRTTGVAGGIAGDNRNSGRVTDCYITANLSGTTVYSAAPNATDCMFDARYTASFDSSAVQANGNALVMSGSMWSIDAEGAFYPRLNSFKTADLADTPLSQASDVAAAHFSFTGSPDAGYSLFASIQVPAAGSDSRFLQSSRPSVLAVSGNEARPAQDKAGEVILSVCLGEEGSPWIVNPCYLFVPTTLAVTYSFNWEDLIPSAKANESYHSGGSAIDTWNSADSVIRISTVSDWYSFANYVNGGGATAGKHFLLDYDLDFGGGNLAILSKPFEGIFDGGCHTISNFTTDGPLFSEVTPVGQVKMLGLVNGTETAEGSGQFYSALIAGLNRGRISNVYAEDCYVIARQADSRSTTVVGGLVAENAGILETSYFYSDTEYHIQTYIETGTGDNLRMGGLTGINSGTVNGCYVVSTLSCTINGVSQQNYKYLSLLVGWNSGQIVYTYWKSHTEISADSILATGYRNSDGTVVSGKDVFFGGQDYSLMARWLSADSYGGSYYVLTDPDTNAKYLKLYSFRMAPYDFTDIFGEGNYQYVMLSLQYTTSSTKAFFANGVTSWNGYMFPNFANLPSISGLSVQLPILSDRLTYTITADSIPKGLTLGTITPATASGKEGGLYTIENLVTDPGRIFVNIHLKPIEQQDTPWGVYRQDSTWKK